jgi:hypothetical protein
MALWCSDFTEGTFPKDRAQQQRFKVAFTPVGGAYVACIRISDGTASLPAAEWKLRCGRTNDFGWVIRRDRSALGAEDELPRSGWVKRTLPTAGVRDPTAVPRDGGIEDYPDPSDAMDAGVAIPQELSTFAPDDAAMLELDSGDANAEALSVLPNERYQLVWCHGKTLFELFLRDYDQDKLKALERFQAREYAVEPFRTERKVAQLRDLSPHEQAFVARQLSTGVEGYHGGWPSLNGMAAAIFDGTARELRKLYLCEWLHWTCTHMVYADPHWPYLLSLRAAIRAAHSGAPIPDLAKDMPPDNLGLRATEMRGYLLNLAWSGYRDARVVRTLVDVRGEASAPGLWRKLAEGLDARYNLMHPARVEPLRPASEFAFTERERNALVAYFEMYALGIRHAGDAEAIDAHWEHVHEALGWLRAHQASLLQGLDEVALTKAIGLQLSRSQAQRKMALTGRFHYLASLHQVPFWEAASVELGTQTAWDRHKPFIAWMAEGSASLSKVFAPLIERHLFLYKFQSKALETAVQHLYRYSLALSSKGYEQTLPRQNLVVRLEPDLAKGTAVAKVLAQGRQTPLLELELLTSVDSMPAQEMHRPLGRADAGTQLKRYRRAVAKGEVRVFQVSQRTLEAYDADLEHASLENFPKALARAATLIKLSVAAGELVNALRQHSPGDVDLSLYWSLTGDTLSAVEAGGDLLVPILQRYSPSASRAAEGLVIGARNLGKLASGVDAIRNVVTGATTLATFFTPDRSETDLARYLDRGQSLPALLEATKGVIQVAAGSSSLGALVLGTGTTLATVSLGVWVGVGAMAIAMLDVLIYAETGGASPTQAFEFEVGRARRAQFLLKEKRLLMPAEKVSVTTSAGSAHQRASCLLARRVGLVHHVVTA